MLIKIWRTTLMAMGSRTWRLPTTTVNDGRRFLRSAPPRSQGHGSCGPLAGVDGAYGRRSGRRRIPIPMIAERAERTAAIVTTKRDAVSADTPVGFKGLDGVACFFHRTGHE